MCGWGEGRGRGGLLHMNINLDATIIIITGQKNSSAFLLTELFIII